MFKLAKKPLRLDRDTVRRTSVDDLVTPCPGVPFSSDPEITMMPSAWNKICSHAQSELRREVGELLLGELFKRDSGQNHALAPGGIYQLIVSDL